MARYWTSDLHWNHRNIVKFTNRSFDTTTEKHDEWLIELWNSQVKDGDIIYHLGDFCFDHKPGRIENIIRRLNGQKRFIMGNHDDNQTYRRLAEQGVLAEADHILRTTIAGVAVEMSHYPWASWRGQARGSLHLHGHSHGNLTTGQGKILDVGLDSAYNIMGEHKFFTEEDILRYMAHRELFTSDHHRNNT